MEILDTLAALPTAGLITRLIGLAAAARRAAFAAARFRPLLALASEIRLLGFSPRDYRPASPGPRDSGRRDSGHRVNVESGDDAMFNGVSALEGLDAAVGLQSG